MAAQVSTPGTVGDDDLLIGRYRLGSLLGRGGMGDVWAAVDIRLERAVAVKLLRPDVAGDPLVRRRFDSEARAAGRLTHPNVVAILDTGDPGGGGAPYIVMERLPGTTLKDALASGPMPVEEVRSLALQVLSALEAAHRAGLVHRDIKPGNILAAGPGQWKVGDFGIAKSVSEAPSDETVTGMVVGTPAYLAPERVYGHPATVASDLFSLGVILYEALAGRRPYACSDTYPWTAAFSGQAPVPIRTIRPETDAVLAAVVDRAVQADPAARFASAVDMTAALRGFGPPVRPAGAAVAAPTHEPTRLLHTGPRSDGSGPPRRRVALVASAAALAAAIVSMAGYGAASSGPGHPVPTTVASVQVAVPTPSTTVEPTTTSAPTTLAPPTTTKRSTTPAPSKDHGESKGKGGD